MSATVKILLAKWKKRAESEENYPPFKRLIDEFLTDLKRLEMGDDKVINGVIRELKKVQTNVDEQ